MKDKRTADEVRRQYRRTTLCVDPELYRSFKAFAAQTGTSVTALITSMMERALQEHKTQQTCERS